MPTLISLTEWGDRRAALQGPPIAPSHQPAAVQVQRGPGMPAEPQLSGVIPTMRRCVTVHEIRPTPSSVRLRRASPPFPVRIYARGPRLGLVGLLSRRSSNTGSADRVCEEVVPTLVLDALAVCTQIGASPSTRIPLARQPAPLRTAIFSVEVIPLPIRGGTTCRNAERNAGCQRRSCNDSDDLLHVGIFTRTLCCPH